jgi:hypothetical protein
MIYCFSDLLILFDVLSWFESVEVWKVWGRKDGKWGEESLSYSRKSGSRIRSVFCHLPRYQSLLCLFWFKRVSFPNLQDLLNQRPSGIILLWAVISVIVDLWTPIPKIHSVKRIEWHSLYEIHLLSFDPAKFIEVPKPQYRRDHLLFTPSDRIPSCSLNHGKDLWLNQIHNYI